MSSGKTRAFFPAPSDKALKEAEGRNSFRFSIFCPSARCFRMAVAEEIFSEIISVEL